MKLTVMKFGGTSMGAADAILQCADVLISQYSEDDRVCAVVSAMSGVTDLLIRSAKAAASGDEAVFGEAQSVLEEKHRVALNALQASEESSQIVFKQIEEFASLCHAVYVLGEVTDRALDAITALGERMSIHLLASALEMRGYRSKAIDAADFVLTDGAHQHANPDMAKTRENADRVLKPLIASTLSMVPPV